MVLVCRAGLSDCIIDVKSYSTQNPLPHLNERYRLIFKRTGLVVLSDVLTDNSSLGAENPPLNWILTSLFAASLAVGPNFSKSNRSRTLR